VGTAIIFPACFATMTHAFPPRQRELALGTQTTTGGLDPD